MEKNNKGWFKKGNMLQDLTDKRFGKLVAVKLSDKRGGRKTYWDCVCDCGAEKTVRTDSLKSGMIKSCGCIKKAQDKINLSNGQGVITHGLSKTRIYKVWNGIVSRCENPNDNRYIDYGGRGISVCEEWKDVSNFVGWAEENGYNDELTIDRINVNGDYEPDNCQWATWKEQANNKRTNHIITHEGMSQTLAQWAEEKNIPYKTLASRISYGIEPPMLFEKENFIRRDSKFLEYNGEIKTLTEWAKETGVKPSAFYERVRRGIKPPKLFYSGNLSDYNKKIPR